MNNKEIAKKQAYIKKTELIFKRLVSFIEKEIGAKFVIDYASHKYTLDELYDKYNLKYLLKVGQQPKQYGVIRTAIEKGGRLKMLTPTVIDYTKLAEKEAEFDKSRERFVENYRKENHPVGLKKYERFMLNKRFDYTIARNPNGSYIIKSEVDNDPNNSAGKRLLFDKETGIPIFKWKKKEKGLGIALKLHMLEEHKMKKYTEKMKLEEEREAKMNLFPDMVREKYKMLREAHIEQLRKDLSDLYCPVSVAVLVKDEQNDTVKKVENFAKVRLKHTRSSTINCDTKLDNVLKLNLSNVFSKAKECYPGKTVTCLHLGTHDSKTNNLVILPTRVAMAA